MVGGVTHLMRDERANSGIRWREPTLGDGRAERDVGARLHRAEVFHESRRAAAKYADLSARRVPGDERARDGESRRAINCSTWWSQSHDDVAERGPADEHAAQKPE